MAFRVGVLSKRLKMLADMVTKGNRVVDIGCDHAYLSIYLVEQGVSPCALAMDVRKGPLSAAEEHIQLCGVSDRIKTRLSDGLQEYLPGEADTCICAGMGGPLMEKILTDSAAKVASLKELILQPQSEIREFRVFLRKNGFLLLEERSMFEDGKFYFAMKVVPGSGERLGEKSDQDLFDAYGEYLLKARDPVLKIYLEKQKSDCVRLTQELATRIAAAKTMEQGGAPGDPGRLQKRYRELLLEQSLLERALNDYL